MGLSYRTSDTFLVELPYGAAYVERALLPALPPTSNPAGPERPRHTFIKANQALTKVKPSRTSPATSDSPSS